MHAQSFVLYTIMMESELKADEEICYRNGIGVLVGTLLDEVLVIEVGNEV